MPRREWRLIGKESSLQSQLGLYLLSEPDTHVIHKDILYGKTGAR